MPGINRPEAADFAIDFEQPNANAKLAPIVFGKYVGPLTAKTGVQFPDVSIGIQNSPPVWS